MDVLLRRHATLRSPNVATLGDTDLRFYDVDAG